MNKFDFFLPTQILFGEGKSSDTGRVVSQYGRICMVVTTPWIPAQTEAFNRIINTIREAGVKVVLFDEACPNPTLASILKGIEIARKECIDVLLGLGGGSSMDTAKAIAVGATHEGTPWDYLYFREAQPTSATLPVITVTTTSGTGSQVTKVSVFTNEETATKSAICHPNIFAKVGIVDPELMYSMPPYLTAVTGFDAFTHAFESYINIGSNPFVDAIALEAIEVIAKNLKTAVTDGNNKEARRKLAYADTLAGITIANVGTTLPHAMGQPISGHAPHVSHGEALALVYPEFVKFTYHSSIDKFAKVAGLFDEANKGKPKEESAAALCDIINNFLKEIGLSLTLTSLKVNAGIINDAIKDCMDFPDMYVNPAVPTKDDLKLMFQNMS